MVVVNSKKSEPPKILCARLKKSSVLLTMLLNSLTKEGQKTGVKRNNYYLLTVDVLYVTKPILHESREYNLLRMLINNAAKLYYTYIMITYE